MKYLVFAIAACLPSFVQAASCDDLTASYSKFDSAMLYFDRASRSDTSALRSETALSAVNNILLRQSIIVNMMIAEDCELPPPPDFQFLGLIAGRN